MAPENEPITSIPVYVNVLKASFSGLTIKCFLLKHQLKVSFAQNVFLSFDCRYYQGDDFFKIDWGVFAREKSITR